jgi:hypothetical protein
MPCRVNVQVLGDSKNVKVEPRVLHLDIAATALQLVRPRGQMKGVQSCSRRVHMVSLHLWIQVARASSALWSCITGGLSGRSNHCNQQL